MISWTKFSVCIDCWDKIIENETCVNPDWIWVVGSDHADCTHDLESEDCPEEEPWFDRTPCAYCWSTLFGHRFVVLLGNKLIESEE